MLRAMVVKINMQVLYHRRQADEMPIQDTSSLVQFHFVVKICEEKSDIGL